MKVRKFVLIDDKTGKVLQFEEAIKGARSFHISGIERLD